MAFSELEKSNIKEKLLIHCEKNWAQLGYKKTNIDDLCAKVGISKGAFYIFYSSKEELFFDVVTNIQIRLINLIETSLGNNPAKINLAATLKLIYREYIKIPFLFEINTSDFIAFMNKLPKEKIEELAFHGNYDVQNIIRKTNLQYKVEEDKGNAAFGILFMPNKERENLPWNHLEVMDFMIDTLVEAIFK